MKGFGVSSAKYAMIERHILNVSRDAYIFDTLILLRLKYGQESIKGPKFWSSEKNEQKGYGTTSKSGLVGLTIFWQRCPRSVELLKFKGTSLLENGQVVNCVIAPSQPELMTVQTHRLTRQPSSMHEWEQTTLGPGFQRRSKNDEMI